MSWVKIDDHFADHPKMVVAGPFAQLLYIKALCYASRYLTDGLIHHPVVKTLVDWTFELHPFHEQVGYDPFKCVDIDNYKLADLLVEVTAWSKVDVGFQIHDYLKYNPSREQVLRTREATRVRVTRVRGNAACNAEGNAISTGSVRSMKQQCNTAPLPDPLPDPDPDPDRKKLLLKSKPSAAPPEFDFEAVYQAYPRKVGKIGGLKKCKSKIRTQEDYTNLCRAVANYAEFVRGKDGEYIKHFSTFMGCWEEFKEPIPVTQKTRDIRVGWTAPDAGPKSVDEIPDEQF